MTDWSVEEWSDFEDWLAIEGFRLQHCAHCDRHPPPDPDAHPSCLIVPLEPASVPVMA